MLGRLMRESFRFCNARSVAAALALATPLAILCAQPPATPPEKSTTPPTTLPAPDAGHDHAGHDHAGHDHAGHSHAGPDQAGRLHAELELKNATRLEAASQKMREHLKQMRLVAVNYHLSDDSRSTNRLRDEWRSLLASGHKVHQQMIDAALEDFKEKPELDGLACQFLTQLVSRNADYDRFDGMLEIVKLLYDHGQRGKGFSLCYGLTASAENEFALAKPHLQEAIKNFEESMEQLAKEQSISESEKQQVAKKLSEIYQLVVDLTQTELYQQQWEAELKAREADAAGEPLPQVLIQTNKGDIVVELFENQVPKTVANFIELCEAGFYDKLPFHRVITHFMAQGGDPNRDGSGGPGYSIGTELNGQTDRGFFRGTLGMALSAAPDSAGSQFFICYMPRAHLTGRFVAFGRVIEGMDFVGDLARMNPDDKEAPKTQELPDEIIGTKVLRKRNHEYKAERLPAR